MHKEKAIDQTNLQIQNGLSLASHPCYQINLLVLLEDFPMAIVIMILLLSYFNHFLST
ncbi:hypothetical protein Mapa_018314 [Marchantia paleacea]|nr:hypothetical protein Mapa_018314 [Marchantia paleacea]